MVQLKATITSIFQDNRKLETVSPKKAKKIQKVVRYKVLERKSKSYVEKMLTWKKEIKATEVLAANNFDTGVPDEPAKPVEKKLIKLGQAKPESETMRREFRKECTAWEKVSPNLCNTRWRNTVGSKFIVSVARGKTKTAYNIDGKFC